MGFRTSFILALQATIVLGLPAALLLPNAKVLSLRPSPTQNVSQTAPTLPAWLEASAAVEGENLLKARGFREWWDKGKGKVKDTWHKAKQGTSDFVDDVKEKFKDSKVGHAYQSAKEYFQGSEDEIEEDETANDPDDSDDSVCSKIGKAYDHAKQSYLDWENEMDERAKNSRLGKAYSQVADKAKDLWETVEEKEKEAWDKFQDWFNSEIKNSGEGDKKAHTLSSEDLEIDSEIASLLDGSKDRPEHQNLGVNKEGKSYQTLLKEGKKTLKDRTRWHKSQQDKFHKIEKLLDDAKRIKDEIVKVTAKLDFYDADDERTDYEDFLIRQGEVIKHLEEIRSGVRGKFDVDNVPQPFGPDGYQPPMAKNGNKSPNKFGQSDSKVDLGYKERILPDIVED